MRTGIIVVDIDPDAGVCLEVDDIPFWVVWVWKVFLLGEKDEVIVTALKWVPIHIEKLLACGVKSLIDEDIVGDGWLGERHWEVRHCEIERILISSASPQRELEVIPTFAHIPLSTGGG
jgi:hypothetical protein